MKTYLEGKSKTLDRSAMKALVGLNLLATPGLGTLMAGRVWAGLAQLTLACAGLVVASIIIARVSEHWNLPFMKCAFKSATGLPCVTCGGTRALRALSRGEFAEAFWLNPLVIAGAFASFIGLVVWLAFPQWSLR